MLSLEFVVSSGEIKVSQESRESALPRGHQHRVTGAALAGVGRVKATKSTHICDKTPDRAEPGLKLHRFGSFGTEHLPQNREEREQPLLTHTAAQLWNSTCRRRG